MKPNTAFPMRIGRLCDAGQTDSRAFNGQIDEVRIWNIAKPQAEILAGYNRHISPTSNGLVGYWNFNIASGTTVQDRRLIPDSFINWPRIGMLSVLRLRSPT
jgi:hypothetical protein